MKKDLVEHLCCPTCRADLALEVETEQAGGVETGSLGCDSCGRSYPILRGVPRFVQSDGYVKSFSYEWNRWNDVQLDIVNGRAESEDTFIEKTGLRPKDVRDKLVLDVGCGAGRFLDVVTRWGGRVIGIDYSFAVEAAQMTLGRQRDVDIIQADVFALPLKDDLFDVIFSIGVLHHTKNTRDAFLKLPRHLKDGGTIAVWLYYYTDQLYNLATDYWRSIFCRVPTRIAYAWSWLLVVLFSRLYKSRLMRRAPFWHVPRVLPVNTHPDFCWRVLDTFDWYTPRFQDKGCSPARVIRWFSEAGLRGLELLDFPTSVRGRRNDAQTLPVLQSVLPAADTTRFVVFGAGAAGLATIRQLQSLDLADRVVAVCDNSPAKLGTVFADHTVQRFDHLDRGDYDFVIVASLPGRAAISEQLLAAGLVAKRDFGTLEFVTNTALPLIRATAA